MRKVFVILLIMALVAGLSACGTPDDSNGLFSAKELQNTDMCVYQYWDSGFGEIPAEFQEQLAVILAKVEAVETMQNGESLEAEEYGLLLKGKNAEYLFCFNDAEEYLSVESPHRYIPLLQVQKTILKNGKPSENQAWICSMDAASYAQVLNLSYNQHALLDGWNEYEKPDEEILQESEIELMRDAYLGWIYGEDPSNRKAVTDEAVRSEIIRIMENAQEYMPSVILPMSIVVGGNGEPAVLLTYPTEDGKIEHIISFLNSKLQMDGAYLYYEEPVVTISRTVWVKENNLYNAVEQSSFQCVISQEDYRWLWNLTQE